eukprot:TRINITY_DN18471_c0_g1_i1.p1 TRINITY_DN18471_c0_g1~~TRINITY_DN18471_c0_g1_i1.p1  ORF type:complete len:661 (-),score=184.57 TRINITY_DN18471_c0_g1_i1:132-2114(-)
MKPTSMTVSSLRPPPPAQMQLPPTAMQLPPSPCTAPMVAMPATGPLPPPTGPLTAQMAATPPMSAASLPPSASMPLAGSPAMMDAGALFDALDRNKDGTVSRAEFARLYEMYGGRLNGAVAQQQQGVQLALSAPQVPSQQLVPEPMERERFSRGPQLEPRLIPPSEIVSAGPPMRVARSSTPPRIVQRDLPAFDDGSMNVVVARQLNDLHEHHARQLHERIGQSQDEMKDFVATLVESRLREFAMSFEEWNTVLKSMQGNLDWQQAQVLELMQARNSPEASVERERELLKRVAVLSGELDAMRSSVRGAASHEELDSLRAQQSSLAREIGSVGERQAHCDAMLVGLQQAFQTNIQEVRHRLDELGGTVSQEHDRLTVELRSFVENAERDKRALTSHLENVTAAGGSEDAGLAIAELQQLVVAERDLARSLEAERHTTLRDLSDRVARLEGECGTAGDIKTLAEAKQDLQSRLSDLEASGRHDLQRRQAPVGAEDLLARMSALERDKADRRELAQEAQHLQQYMDGLREALQGHLADKAAHSGAPTQLPERGLQAAREAPYPDMVPVQRAVPAAGNPDEEQSGWDMGLSNFFGPTDLWKVDLTDGEQDRSKFAGYPQEERQHSNGEGSQAARGSGDALAGAGAQDAAEHQKGGFFGKLFGK